MLSKSLGAVFRSSARQSVSTRHFTVPLQSIASSCVTTPTTLQLKFDNPNDSDTIPMFQVMDLEGKLWPGASRVDIDKATAVKMYELMAQMQTMDTIFNDVQRQGRISFYMQAAGEESALIGSASALEARDVVFAQYREVGVLLWRGFTIQQCADQCFSNSADLGKGRQMPVHYGSAALNFHTISSPLATQLPQAVGAAYSLKNAKEPSVAICYFGEGAASEGDFHAGMNFAATLEAPIIFFCRNNGYAISTPTADQFRGDGIVSRAAGYGMHSIRVDGNDLLAVRAATAEARRIAIEKNCPVLIEAMSYRRGHHSTSDDSTRYRDAQEIKNWHELDPVKRFKNFISSNGWWDEQQETQLRERERAHVLQCLQVAEQRAKPSIDELFTDVYDEKLPHMVRQEKELKEHISKYPGHYNSDAH